jgi:hypothetical protein|nr:MAG TPA: hypothetical protein [Bacteriophage sp.]
MIDFGQFLCIIQSILFLLTLVSFDVDDSEKFSLIFMSCWIMSILMLCIYHTFNVGGAN